METFFTMYKYDEGKLTWVEALDWFLYDNGLRHERVNNNMNMIDFISGQNF